MQSQTKHNLMKRIIIPIFIALIVMTGCAQQKPAVTKSEGSITFVVDGDLPRVKEYFYPYDGNKLARYLLDKEAMSGAKNYNIIATSFANEQNIRFEGEDSFYQCLVYAYANHRSVTISPDMIWMLISQGFARYVNAHAEKLREQLVDHSEKMDLVINSEVDVLSEDADWPSLIDNFASQIDKYTKNDIAKTITADFSTTTSVERIASQITLMESVKSYFEFIVTYMSCGIPYITLEGTPNDWQQVLEKTRKLGSYGKLGKWTQDLEPILNEFIFASEGQPNHNFWRQMVKKQRVDRLKGGGCSSEEPTKLDGWMLKLFPDENGNTLSSIYHTKNMPTEYVKVGFKYCVIDPGQGMITNETPMELWAGFIGAEDDTINNMLTPKIGWLVCSISQNNDELLKELKDRWAIELRVQEVPEVLSRIEHIRNLRLEFTDKVVIPEWFYNISIDNLSIKGDVTKEDKAKLLEYFPKAYIRK